eukprot:g1824.t1
MWPNQQRTRMKAHRTPKGAAFFSPRFVSKPQVRTYIADTPTKYYMESRDSHRPEHLTDEEIKLEFEVRNCLLEAPSERQNREEFLLMQWDKDFRADLERWSLSAPARTSKEELQMRKEFCERIYGRSHLWYTQELDIRTFTVEQLLAELRSRSEALEDRKSRAHYEDRLVAALIKEGPCLIGLGYDHGMRKISVHEELEELSDAELRQSLKERGVKSVPRKKKEKFDMLHDALESERKEAIEEAFDKVLVNELMSRKIECDVESLISRLCSFYDERSKVKGKNPWPTMEASERRTDTDGNAYTFDEYREFYGEEYAESKWQEATPERRIDATDGYAYTYSEFCEYYADGADRWKSATVIETNSNRHAPESVRKEGGGHGQMKKGAKRSAQRLRARLLPADRSSLKHRLLPVDLMSPRPTIEELTLETEDMLSAAKKANQSEIEMLKAQLASLKFPEKRAVEDAKQDVAPVSSLLEAPEEGEKEEVSKAYPAPEILTSAEPGLPKNASVAELLYHKRLRREAMARETKYAEVLIAANQRLKSGAMLSQIDELELSTAAWITARRQTMLHHSENG